jgi:gliding motility-associated-like protein
LKRKLLLSFIAGALLTSWVKAQVPVAKFIPTNSSGCASLLVTFVPAPSSATGWSWNFGGVPPDVTPSGTSTQQTPTVFFNKPGVYTVTLIESNGSGNSLPYTQDITVLVSPTVDFIGIDSAGCFPLHVNFQNFSTAGAGNTIVSWAWDFGDGGAVDSTNFNPSHIYTLPGSQAVFLSVKSSNGCPGNKVKPNYINIPNGVLPDFSSSVTTSCKPPTAVNFTNLTSGGAPGITYSWNFGDASPTSVLTNPSHNYIATGFFIATLTATGSGGCIDSFFQKIKISGINVTSSFVAPDSVCAGTSVQFQNTSNPQPGSSFWKFGDGTSSNLPSPSKTYAGQGSYTITLINNYGSCNDSANKLIQVFKPPTPNFSVVGNTLSCTPPLTVQFQDLSGGVITAWSWDFGDGTFSNVKNPMHTYNTYGRFNVKLVASNASGCSDSVTKNQVVQIVKPFVKISNLPGFGCAPYTFSPALVDTVVDGIASYAWDFGNGNTYNVANPPAQVYGSGTFVVRLTIVSNGGCSASTVDTIKVGTIKPSPAFSAVPTSVCVGISVNFKDLSTGPPDQWLWEFGDGGISNLPNPSYTYAVPGTYSVKLIVYNQGCNDSVTQNNLITVNPPQAKFGWTINCSNISIFTFKDFSIGPVATYDWDFGDGGPHYTLGPVPPPHTYATFGLKTVVLKLTGTTGCNSSISKLIFVGSSPSFVASATTICKNTTVIISPTNNAGIGSYTFIYGDGDTLGPVSNSNWAHIYANAGVYTVTMYATNVLGCIDTVTKTNYITVNGPKADFTVNSTLSCSALAAVFTDQSTTDGTHAIVSRLWDFGDGTSSPNPTHTYSTQGIYSVKLKVTDAAGCSDSLFKGNYITVSIPKPLFTTSDTSYCPSSVIQFNNTSTGGFTPSYSWDFGNGNTFNGPNPPSQNYPLVGNYTVKLNISDINGCKDSLIVPRAINIDTPAAYFTVDDSVASCPPLITHFTFKGHYARSVNWTFGDGSTSNILNPTHPYVIPGAYGATLIVTSPGGCTARFTDSMRVFGPYGLLSYSPQGGCDTLTVNFNILTSGVVKYTWIFGDGTAPVNTAVPFTTHFYDSAGDFVPQVTLQDAAGCQVPVILGDTIKVVGVHPNFGFDKKAICGSGTMQFSDSTKTNGPITNWFWDFGDGIISTFQNPSHFYAGTGLYNVKLVITTQFGCKDSITKQIKVVAVPSVDITGANSQCVPATLNFNGIILVADTSALSWSWDFFNGQSSILQTPPAQNYPLAGNDSVRLIATNSSGCMDTVTKNFIIYPLPPINAGADTTICLGQSLQLQAVNAASYTWLPPSNSSLSCNNCSNPVGTPIVTTSYIVTGTSLFGCQASDTIVVTVNQPVTVIVSPDDSVCLGKGVQLVASGAALYSWSPVAGLSDPAIANPVASPLVTTTYQVIGSDNKYCFSDTQNIKVTVFNYPTVNIGPDVTINIGSSYQIQGTGSPDIVSINWLPITGLSCTNCLSPLATPQMTTTYVVNVTNNGTCPAADSLKITVVCNNTNFFVPNTFSPNGDGVNDVFYVRGKGLHIIPSMVIYNRWGQIVFEKRDFAPNDPSAGWDGTINGKKAPLDVYVYTIEIICDNSTLLPYHGNVALIK